MSQVETAVSLEELLAQANEAAELSNIDMSEVSSGPERKLLPAGYCVGTLIEYIELGSHIGEFNGQPKKQADALFRLGFALSFPDKYLNDDGTPYILRTFDLSLSNNSKARAKKAFDRMNYLQTAKHFAQFLGKSFLIEIKVVKSKTGKERNEINFDTIAAPVDPMSGQPYPVPAAKDLKFRLFLFDKPTKAGWDSLFVEGEYKDDTGKVTSKNFIQETIRRAVNYPGSAVELMLGGPIPDITAPAALAEPVAVPTAPALPATPAIPAVTAPAIPAIPPLLGAPA